MNAFKKNPNYLLIYCAKTVLILSALCAGLYLFKGVSFEISLAPWMAILPIISILLCALPSAVLHNCAHSNTGPKAVNDMTGEILGTFMLYGFKGFRLGHMFHHKYPDNPKYDVHPPKGHDFLSFLVSPIKATLDVVERAYYEEHGYSQKTVNNIRAQKILFNLGIVLRIAFWFLLFGPTLFVLLYLPTYFLNIFVFAHINFVAHRENADGTSEIINLNSNLYYKIVNRLSFGGYFHKNHHRRPRAFNPSKIVIENDVPYITYYHGTQIEELPLASLAGGRR